MTTGKTIASTRRTFVGKVMSLLFSVLSLLITRGERANSFSVASIPDSSSHCWGLLLRPLQCPNRLRWAFAARNLPRWHSGKGSICQGRRCWFDPWVRKIRWRRDRLPTPVFLGFPGGSADKESAGNAGDLGLIPGLGRSLGVGKGYPLQHSGLENSMDFTVHGVTKSWTRLSNFYFLCITM